MPDAIGSEAAGVERPDLGRPRRIHLIGIGGTGMSAIAVVLSGMGHRVTGSDASPSGTLDELAAHGIDVHAGHDGSHLGDAEVVAASTAIPAGNVEVIEASSRGLRVWRRAELLSAMCTFRRTVAVAGTHGKTTTSSMLALILRHAGLHPSMVVGGEIVGVGIGGAWDHDGEWMVVEADESDGTFLALGAEAVVVTSVEADHLDYYGSDAAMRDAYARFVERASGPRVLALDDPGAAALARIGGGRGGPVITYGSSPVADVRIAGAQLTASGSRFSLALAGGETVGPFGLAVPGLHNVANATGALAMATELGVTWETAGAGLGLYRGTRRRFELRGEAGGVTFVDDYAHLPAEVAATVRAAQAGGWRRVVAVFQPHRFSRTESLWKDFAGAFEGADLIVVTGIYPAGEAPRPGVTGRMVAEAVSSGGASEVRYAETLDETEALLQTVLEPGDLCLTMGAGDLTTLPDRFLGAGGAGA